MKKNILLSLALCINMLVFAQVPQGFSYQAVARDADGKALASASLTVRIGLLQGSTLVWQEDHQVQTSQLGLFNLSIGDQAATKTGGTLSSFSEIAWGLGDYSLEVSIDRGNGFTSLGSSGLMSVPYALYALNGPGGSGDGGWERVADTLYTGSSVGIGTASPKQGMLAIQANDPQIEKPLFEVRNNAGNPVFAVFNDGVMVYVDEQKKGNKGGFAVGGYNAASKGVTQEYLRITPDSVRIWVPDDLPQKGQKGGFAVGGYNATSKGPAQNLLEVSSSNTSIYFDTTAQAKGVKGGFAVGGYNAASKGTSDQLMSLTRQNYLIGQDAGSNITSGTNNTFFGWKAGVNNTIGSENIFVGKLSGFNNLDAFENIFIGNESGYNTIFGYGNVYLGNQSGYANEYGYFNSIIGYQAGYYNESHYNTFLGFQSGFNNTSGLNNIAIGFQAGLGFPVGGSGISGDDNVFIGNSAGAYTTSGNGNIMIGSSTGYSNLSGENNVFIGNEAGYSNNQGNNNVMMGYQAGYNNFGGGGFWDANFNVFIGQTAGYSNVSGGANVYMGYEAGYSNESGTYLTAIGHQAGKNATGQHNTLLGAEAGKDAVTGDYNTYLGSFAGREGEGQFNTFLGYAAGYFMKSGDNNVLLGTWSGGGASQSSYNNNTYVGASAGLFTSTGSNNVYLGNRAGFNTSDGSNNVFIGNNAGYNETGSNRLYIANTSTTTPLIYGDFGTGELRINGNAGVNYQGIPGYGLILDTPASQTEQYVLYGLGSAYFSGTVYQASDKNYKTNIVPVAHAMDKLREINGVYFDYDQSASESKSEHTQSIGVIAQEVEKVFPEIVKENLEGMKAVNYSALIPVLIEALKEQQTQIDTQQEEIRELKAALERLL